MFVFAEKTTNSKEDNLLFLNYEKIIIIINKEISATVTRSESM